MGIVSFSAKNPEFPSGILEQVMQTYYGGRTEDRIRKEPVNVSYIDFTSMIPRYIPFMDYKTGKIILMRTIH
ncbi:MAG: hypothetical protein OEM28_02270 [Nitrosopumilus sp.]|nr:hypothetical protein [Nitrosopumilus sp.]MDH3488663.1 hypothetical protein [Nitrosopumilus sp.]